MSTDEPFKIYLDRLQGDHVEQIEEVVPSTFLDVHETDLAFAPEVKMSGEAYIASDHLIIRLKVTAEATLPCSICNQAVTIPVLIQNFYHTEDLTETKSAIFDFTDPLRESILLNTPDFIECHDGICPERETLSKFLQKEDRAAATNQQFPFSNLD